MHVKIGERLQAIADMVPVGVTMADIGTDHAYLPIYLISHNVVARAIAGDIHQGPYLSAKNAVVAAQLEEFISVRRGNGLEVVRPGEAETVVIAGMGGLNIIDILRSRPEVTATLKRLIVQPMIAAAAVRMWLQTNGWQIISEQLIQEDGKLYQIIAAEPGESQPFEPILYEIGPLLWHSRHPLLLLHIEELIVHLRGVLAAMAGSAEAVHSAKYREFADKLKDLEDKRTCL
jgi:tRNA (adenine22-N1)-methyltransferase